MPFGRENDRQSGPSLRETQFNQTPFEFPENLSELTLDQREELRRRYLEHTAGRLSPSEDAAVSPSRVYTREETDRHNEMEELERVQQQIEETEYRRSQVPNSLPYVEGVGFLDESIYASGARYLTNEEKEEVLNKQKQNKEKMQRDQELKDLNSAQMDAENRFGDL